MVGMTGESLAKLMIEAEAAAAIGRTVGELMMAGACACIFGDRAIGGSDEILAVGRDNIVAVCGAGGSIVLLPLLPIDAGGEGAVGKTWCGWCRCVATAIG